MKNFMCIFICIVSVFIMVLLPMLCAVTITYCEWAGPMRDGLVISCITLWFMCFLASVGSFAIQDLIE